MNSFLPKLDNPIVTGTAESGTWADIHNIRDDFTEKITVYKYDVEEISSFIPNMWSRIVLFKMITKSKSHPLASHLIGEIKGLFAVIALRNIYNFNVTMPIYKFNVNNTLNNIATSLFPHTISSFHLIKVEDEIVGGCIDSDYYRGFFTGAEYELPNVPWFDKKDKILKDPVVNNMTGHIEVNIIKDALGCWKNRISVNDINNIDLGEWQHSVPTICSIEEQFLLPAAHPLKAITKYTKPPLPFDKILLRNDNNVMYESQSKDCKILPINADGFKELYSYSKQKNQEINCAIEDKNVTVGIGQDKITSKTYDKKITIELPTVCLWPDFMADDWDEYYIWQGKSGDITVEPIVESDVIPQHPNKGSSYSITWITKNLPIALKVIKGEQEIGIIEVKYSKKQILDPVDPDKTYEIGFDFGTTHTTIAIKSRDGEPEIIKIKDRIRWLTKSKENIGEFTLVRDNGKEIRINQLDFIERDFMPSTPDIPATMPTLYKKRTDEIAKPKEILDGIAVVAKKQFPPYDIDHNVFSDRVITLMTEPFIERLKWKGEPDRKYIGVYLPHLIKLVKAEIRSKKGRINDQTVRWAYPIAMDEDKQKALKKFFNNSELFMPESEAVAYCFEAKIHAATPSISIDIGGGTTDIALWSSGTLYLESSIKLAGNVCNEFIKRNPDFLEKKDSDDKLIENKIVWFNEKYGKYAEQFKIIIEDKPESTLSTILSLYGDVFADNYINYGGSNDKNLKNLNELILFSYCSLLYYAGLMLSSTGLQCNKVDIYCAGNGWRNFDWIFGHRFDSKFDSNLENIMKKVFIESLGSNINVNLNRSSQPKCEVAIGLLEKPNSKVKLTISPNAKKSILGEDGFYIDKNVKNFSYLIEPNNKFDKSFPKTFIQYEKFIKCIEAVSIGNLPSSSIIFDDVEHEIKQIGLAIKEPPFFTIVKAAIRKKWGVIVGWD